MQNPSPEQMRDMIEALFAKTDEFRAQLYRIIAADFFR